MATTLINSINHPVLFQQLKLNVASHITKPRLVIIFVEFFFPENTMRLPQHFHFGFNYFGCTENKGEKVYIAS